MRIVYDGMIYQVCQIKPVYFSRVVYYIMAFQCTDLNSEKDGLVKKKLYLHGNNSVNCMFRKTYWIQMHIWMHSVQI